MLGWDSILVCILVLRRCHLTHSMRCILGAHRSYGLHLSCCNTIIAFISCFVCNNQPLLSLLGLLSGWHEVELAFEILTGCPMRLLQMLIFPDCRHHSKGTISVCSEFRRRTRVHSNALRWKIRCHRKKESVRSLSSLNRWRSLESRSAIPLGSLRSLWFMWGSFWTFGRVLARWDRLLFNIVIITDLRAAFADLNILLTVRCHSIHDVLVIIDYLCRWSAIMVSHSQVVVFRLWTFHSIMALHMAFVNLLDRCFWIN